MRLEFDQNVAPAAPPHDMRHGAENIDSADSLLEQGIAAARSGDRELAREFLQRSADMKSSDPDAWMWLASIAEYPEELLACLDRVLAIDPVNQRALDWQRATRALIAKTMVQRASVALDGGDAVRAEELFDQALTYDRDCELGWAGKAAVAEDEYDKVEYLRRVLSINPKNEDAAHELNEVLSSRAAKRLEAARLAVAEGDNQEALGLLDQVIKLDSANVNAWMLRSHICAVLPGKLDALEHVLKIDPANAAAKASLDFLTSTIPSETAGPVAGESSQLVHTAEIAAPVFDIAPEYLPVEEADIVPEASAEAVAAVFEKAQSAYGQASLIETDLQDERESANADPSSCPFCGSSNVAQLFECPECRATLTLSDIDRLLSNSNVKRYLVQEAVLRMEAEWNEREFSADELRSLGIGHFNLGDTDQGVKYLREASRLAPNDVILSGQVNAVLIRLDELSRQSEIDDARPKGRTILVVDDSATVRKLISGKLEKAGHNVVCAEDGIEGLARISQQVPDLVLLDITMPRMDGYEVCRQIRSNPETKSIPVVMISGKDGFFDKVRGRMAGTTAYITKPFGPETLMKALETYLTHCVHTHVADIEEEPLAV